MEMLCVSVYNSVTDISVLGTVNNTPELMKKKKNKINEQD